MGKVAFLFPGQGAQKVGMGKDFYEQSKLAANLIDQASDVLGLDLKKLCFEENNQLNLTEYTQVALVTVCLAMARTAKEKGLNPQMTAGLSLGEYCAIAMTGAMNDLEAISAVRKRGIFMEQAVPNGIGTMAAVLGLSGEKVFDIVKNIEGVFVANYNCPGQVVITGKTQNIEEAKKRLIEAGAKRVLPLKVSGPFHSPYLEEAGKKLEKELDKIQWKNPMIPYVTNVTAKAVTQKEEIKGLLKKQVSSSVLWQQSIEYMIQQGVDTFVEIGPGNTLSSLMKKINREVKVYQIGTMDALERICSEQKGEN